MKDQQSEQMLAQDFGKRLQIGGAVIALLLISMVATFRVKPLTRVDATSKKASVTGTQNQVLDLAALSGKVDTSSPRRATHNSGVRGAINLTSVGRDYTYVFSGKVDCRKTCSDTHIRISLLSTSDTQIERTVDVDADGSYNLPLQFRESEGDQVDWRLTVENSKQHRREFTGRTILMDHPTIEISHSIPIG